MKVLLIKDVYKLGRAGEIKKVADGYGRNYLVPYGLALPATAGSLKLAEAVGKKAAEKRAILNNELKGIAEIISDLELDFPVKAGETGKLYGSVSSQMVADKIKEMRNIEIGKHQLVMEPIRNVGEYMVPVQLTLDLVPELKVVIRREGEVKTVHEVAVATEEEADATEEVVEETSTDTEEEPAVE